MEAVQAKATATGSSKKIDINNFDAEKALEITRAAIKKLPTIKKSQKAKFYAREAVICIATGTDSLKNAMDRQAQAIKTKMFGSKKATKKAAREKQDATIQNWFAYIANDLAAIRRAEKKYASNVFDALENISPGNINKYLEIPDLKDEKAPATLWHLITAVQQVYREHLLKQKAQIQQQQQAIEAKQAQKLLFEQTQSAQSRANIAIVRFVFNQLLQFKAHIAKGAAPFGYLLDFSAMEKLTNLKTYFNEERRTLLLTEVKKITQKFSLSHNNSKFLKLHKFHALISQIISFLNEKYLASEKGQEFAQYLSDLGMQTYQQVLKDHAPINITHVYKEKIQKAISQQQSHSTITGNNTKVDFFPQVYNYPPPSLGYSPVWIQVVRSRSSLYSLFSHCSPIQTKARFSKEQIEEMMQPYLKSFHKKYYIPRNKEDEFALIKGLRESEIKQLISLLITKGLLPK